MKLSQKLPLRQPLDLEHTLDLPKSPLARLQFTAESRVLRTHSTTPPSTIQAKMCLRERVWQRRESDKTVEGPKSQARRVVTVQLLIVRT